MKRNIRIASVTMWVSLLGLLSFQIYWVSTAYSQKKKEIETDIEDAFAKANNGLMMRKLADMSGMEIEISANGSFFSPDTIIIASGSSANPFGNSITQSFSYSMNKIESSNKTLEDLFSGEVLMQIQGALDELPETFDVPKISRVTRITEADIDFMDSLLGFYLRPFDMDQAYVFSYGSKGKSDFVFSGSQEIRLKNRDELQSFTQPLSFGGVENIAQLSFPENKVVKASLSSISLVIVASVLMLLLFAGAWYYIVKSLQKQYHLATMKDDFISNMTHELKTPVTASSLALEVISKNTKVKDDTQLTNLIGIAKTEQERMLSMIDTILESTTEKGMRADDLTELCLNEELEAVIETIRMKVDELGGSLGLNVTDEKMRVNASQVHIQNAMINLLENAIKYANGAPHIQVNMEREGKMALLQVADQGIGISKEDQKRVFEKFFRVHTGNVHTIKGYGLGLSYTKAVIERCGGEITVQSELNKGTTFTIKLPLIHDS